MESTTTVLTPQQDDVLPILRALPLDEAALKAQSIDPSEILWALTSVTGFLSNKASRTLLLTPQHNLVSRVLLQLKSENPVQLRNAASGCLRNLCIEAGGKIRKVLESNGCAELCIKEIKALARELGLLAGLASDQVPYKASSKQKAAPALNKSKDEMNRKERRLAAKAEAAAAKRGDKTMDDASDIKLDADANGAVALADSHDGDDDDEQALLCCSHLTNLLSILWCLAEVSPQTVDLCHQSAAVLSHIFSAAVGSALDAIQSLWQTGRANGHTEGEDAKKGTRVDIGKRDKMEKDRAMVQVALTALNALVTLTDADQEFSAAFVGVSKQELRSSLKGKKKGVVIEHDDSVSDSREAGMENLGALSLALARLNSLPEDEEEAGLRRQATSLALLSMAALRNIQSCLPDEIRTSLQVPVQLGEQGNVTMMTIGSLELEVGLASLTAVLTRADNRLVEGIMRDLQSQARADEEQADMSKNEKRAEEEINNLNLALEILAELAGDREGWNVQVGKVRKSEQETIEVDEEGDQDMDEDEEEDDGQSDLSLDPQDEEMFLGDGGKDMEGLDFAAARIVGFFSPSLIDALLLLGVSSQAAFTGEQESHASASLRALSIRALSVLNNQSLVLASFAQQPASQPAKQEDIVRSFHAWLRQSNVALLMARLWRWQFECASRMAALPCVGNPEDSSSQAQDGRKVVEIALCIMWSLSRCYEGLGEQSSKVIVVDAASFAGDDFCRAAQVSHGVVDSLMAAYRSSKRGPNAMLPPSSEANEANAGVQLAPTPDGIRIHSLGVLSTLVRQPNVSMDGKVEIVGLLADTLEVLPTSAGLESQLTSLQMSDATSMDAMIVAVNGLIDTFADETSEWDAAYTQLRLQSRLKRASVDVKSAVSGRVALGSGRVASSDVLSPRQTRTIDKRRHPTLRGAADEAWSNLVAFVQYRDGLGATKR